MSDAKEDEILKRIGDVRTDISAMKSSTVSSSDFKTKTDNLMKAIKEGPETSKNIFESLFEALGFKDVFAALKDGGDWGSKILLALGAIATVLLGKLLDVGKLFNAGLEKVWRALANRRDRRAGRPERGEGRVLAIGESGLPQIMTRGQSDSLNSVSINPHNITPTQLEELKTALSGLPEKIRDFNSATGAMQSPGAIKKITKAVGDLKDKLTPSPKTTIEETAEAIGKLTDKLQHYEPHKLPKAQDLRNVQHAAHDLAETAETLRSKFMALSNGFGAAAGALGTP